MAFDILPLGSVSFRSQMSMGRKYEDQKKERESKQISLPNVLIDSSDK